MYDPGGALMEWNTIGKWLMQQRGLLIFFAVFYAMLAVDARAEEFNTITIGIISPKDGSGLVLAGESHDESIRLAFSHLGPLQVGDLQIMDVIITLLAFCRDCKNTTTLQRF